MKIKTAIGGGNRRRGKREEEEGGGREKGDRSRKSVNCEKRELHDRSEVVKNNSGWPQRRSILRRC